MIYIFDNGESYSNHALYFVEAPEDFGAWFNDVYRSWVDGAEYRPLMIVAMAPSIEQRAAIPFNLRPIRNYEVPFEEEPEREFSTMPVIDFLAKIVEQARDGEPRPRYRLEGKRGG